MEFDIHPRAGGGARRDTDRCNVSDARFEGETFEDIQLDEVSGGLGVFATDQLVQARPVFGMAEGSEFANGG
ncbi:hypothetical protein [Desulfosarcina cetonica]|uniref:hypothetical protein n=1 Tax=Desulfosarcina cetonica TaxID=90730 RepID=UPI0006D245BA|nr:hypothetical protein [Desulfosarcina cetonica]